MDTPVGTLPLPDADSLLGLDVAGPVTAVELLPHFEEPPQDVVGAARLADGRLFVAHLRMSVILPAEPDPKQTAMVRHAAETAHRLVRRELN